MTRSGSTRRELADKIKITPIVGGARRVRVGHQMSGSFFGATPSLRPFPAKVPSRSHLRTLRIVARVRGAVRVARCGGTALIKPRLPTDQPEDGQHETHSDRGRGSSGCRPFGARLGTDGQPRRERSGYAGPQSWRARIDAVHDRASASSSALHATTTAGNSGTAAPIINQ
jgi:hypothetical protein